MSYPVYYVPSGDVLPVLFATYDGGTGASITLTGLAVTDIEIYKDGGVTQRASDAGYTLLDTDGIDFDTITGIHGFSIDTGDNTDAGFYTIGSWFTVVVSAVTVDAQTVNFIACQFRLMAAESVAAKPKVDVDAWLGTAAATPTAAGVPEVDVTHWLGSAAPANTGDAFARLGAPAGASVSADIAAVKVDTAAILVDTGTTLDARIPAALVGGRMDANVGAISADAVAADNAEAFFDGTGYAGTNNVIPTVTTLTGHTAQTGDSFARLGAPVGASVSADIAAVKVDTAATLADTGTDGVVVAAGSKTGYSIGTGGIAAAAFAAGAVDAAAIAANAIGSSEIADGALTDAKFDSTGKLRSHFSGVLKLVVGTGSTTTAIVFSTVDGAAASATNDFYNGRVIVFTSGTLAGQATDITDYVGATVTATVTALTGSAANGDTAVIV